MGILLPMHMSYKRQIVFQVLDVQVPWCWCKRFG